MIPPRFLAAGLLALLPGYALAGGFAACLQSCAGPQAYSCSLDCERAHPEEAERVYCDFKRNVDKICAYRPYAMTSQRIALCETHQHSQAMARLICARFDVEWRR